MQREQSTSVLDNIHSIPQLSENKNQKWMFKSYMSLVYFVYVISVSFYTGCIYSMRFSSSRR